jgi:hypothetical protein
MVEHQWDGKLEQILALTAATLVGATVFVGMHVLMRSPEIGWIKASLPRRGGAVEVLPA